MVRKNITLRYKQSYPGNAWLVLRPLMMVAILMVMQSLVRIDSDTAPFSMLTYCAMVPWVFFQEAASDGVGSVVQHANPVKKICFPREIFPLFILLTTAVQLDIGLAVLVPMIAWYDRNVTLYELWLLPLLLYAALAAPRVCLDGAAANVYLRGVAFSPSFMYSFLRHAKSRFPSSCPKRHARDCRL